MKKSFLLFISLLLVLIVACKEKQVPVVNQEISEGNNINIVSEEGVNLSVGQKTETVSELEILTLGEFEIKMNRGYGGLSLKREITDAGISVNRNDINLDDYYSLVYREMEKDIGGDWSNIRAYDVNWEEGSDGFNFQRKNMKNRIAFLDIFAFSSFGSDAFQLQRKVYFTKEKYDVLARFSLFIENYEERAKILFETIPSQAPEYFTKIGVSSSGGSKDYTSIRLDAGDVGYYKFDTERFYDDMNRGHSSSIILTQWFNEMDEILNSLLAF